MFGITNPPSSTTVCYVTLAWASRYSPCSNIYEYQITGITKTGNCSGLPFSQLMNEGVKALIEANPASLPPYDGIDTGCVTSWRILGPSCWHEVLTQLGSYAACSHTDCCKQDYLVCPKTQTRPRSATPLGKTDAVAPCSDGCEVICDYLYVPAHNIGLKPSIGNSGVQIVDSRSGSEVFPNPVKDRASISYNYDSRSPASIEVFAMDGKKVMSANANASGPGWQKFDLDTQLLSNGVYMYRITVSDGVEQSGSFLVRH